MSRERVHDDGNGTWLVENKWLWEGTWLVAGMARVGTYIGEGHEARVTWLDGGHIAEKWHMDRREHIAWWRAHDWGGGGH